MKKIIITVILATLMLFVFAACGEKTVSAEAEPQISKATEADKPTTTTADPNAPKEIDIFEYIEIEYSGIAPDGKAYIDEDKIPSQIDKNAKFELDKTSGLKNGDTITITCTPKKGLLELENLVPISLTKEIVIEGMPEYITDISKYDLTLVDKDIDEYAKSSLTVKDTEYEFDLRGFEFRSDGMLHAIGGFDEWKIDNENSTCQAKYYFTRKTTIEDTEKYNRRNFLLYIYLDEKTATKTKAEDPTSELALGTQDTFIKYRGLTTADIYADTEGSPSGKPISTTEFFWSYKMPGDDDSTYKQLTSADEVYAEYVRVYGEAYDITKID
jgi:hypothetical protein